MKNETVRFALHQVDRIAQQKLAWLGHVSRMGSERLPVKALWEEKSRNERPRRFNESFLPMRQTSFYAQKQLLLSARLSHRNSVCPSVRHTGKSAKK